MALVLKDRVKEQTTTTGTGSVTLGGTTTGFESFSAVGDGNTTYYAIVHQTADEWEVGLGTYTAAGTLLSRDTILESSNSDAAVVFSAGTKDVFVTYPSDKAVYADAAGEVSVTRATSATFATSATEAATAIFATSATNATNAVNVDGGTVSSTDGTFNTLTVVTSASVGGGFNVGGNVGIGTSSPGTRLEVVGVIRSSGTSPVMSVLDTNAGTDEKEWHIKNTNGPLDIQAINDAGGGGGGFLRLTRSANNVQTLQGYRAAVLRYELSNWDNHLLFSAADSTVGTSSAHALIFDTNNIERMRIDSSGNLLVGTTSATTDLAYSPKLKLSGNGPGLYFEETDTSQDYSITALGGKFYIRDATAVVPRLTIDSSGNVGIGTASPSQKLTVEGTDARIYLTGANTDINMTGTADGQLSLDGNGFGFGIALNSSGANLYTNSASRALILGTDETERMRITGTGLVGIGTTSPAQELHVVGKTRIQRSSNANLEITSDNNTGVNPFLVGSNSDTFYIKNQAASGFGTGGDFIQYSESGSLRLMGTNYIDSSGNVGIGNAAPSYLLDLYKAASTVARIRNSAATGGTPSTTHGEFVIESTDANMGMQFLGSTTANQRILFGDTDSGGSGQVIYDHTSNYMALSTNGSEAVRINSSNNVGIGTTSPSQKLAVGGSASGTVALQVTNSTAGTAFNNGMQMFINDTAGGLNMREAYPLQFYVNGAERMRITSSGNVGIGTSSPAKQFEITKSARATITSLTDGATITPDFDAAQNFAVTLGGNRTLANPSNIDPGQTGSIFVVQDVTGGRTLSFGSYWKFAGGTAPTLSTGTSATDRIDYVVQTSTAIHAVASLNLS